MKPARFILRDAARTPRPDLASSLSKTTADYRELALHCHWNLLVGTETPYIVAADRRVVLIGTVFDRNGKAVSHLGVPNSIDAPSTSRWLFEHYWGSYVAIIAGSNGEAAIARDPSATMPCYAMNVCGSVVMGSHVRDMAAFTGEKPCINWTQLVHHLNTIQYRCDATSLSNVVEVLPGTIFVPGQKDRGTIAWSPWQFARREALIRDQAEAVACLRQTMMLVFRAWAARFQSGLIALSGGLDSSILAAGLVHAGLSCSAVTLLSGTSSGDERYYASAVADRLGIDLESHNLLDQPIDITKSEASHLPRPTARMFWQSADKILSDVGQRRCADAHFHGGGGDNLFCYLQSVTPVLDRLRLEGIGSGTITTIRDICSLTESDVWDALKRTADRWWSGRRHYRWAVDQSMLSDTAKAMGSPDFNHPWLDVPAAGLPGSAAHIALLLAIQNYLEGYRRELTVPVVAPFMSQPLVEICLRIPSWMWCHKGMNRSVAREALADLLPPEVLVRRSKGTPDGYAIAIFERQRQQIGEFLHYGALARHDLIDMAAIDAALAQDGPVRGLAYSRILALCDVEAWIQSWL